MGSSLKIYISFKNDIQKWKINLVKYELINVILLITAQIYVLSSVFPLPTLKVSFQKQI